MTRPRPTLMKDIDRNDIVFSMLKEQDTYKETNDKIQLTPEFYYVYEMIRQIYSLKDTEEKLLEKVESSKKVFAKKVPNLFITAPGERREDLVWPENEENTRQEIEDIEVEVTGLLVNLMRLFPKDYLSLKFFLTGRASSDNNNKLQVPSNLSGYLESIGLYHEEYFPSEEQSLGIYYKTKSITEFDTYEHLSVRRSVREYSYVAQTTPWIEPKGTQAYLMDHVEFTKLNFMSDVGGASKLLFLLGNDYFTLSEKENNNENLESFLYRGKVEENSFLNQAEGEQIKDVVKEQVMKSIEKKGLENVSNFLKKDVLFPTFPTLASNNVIGLLNSPFERLVDRSFWETQAVKIPIRERRRRRRFGEPDGLPNYDTVNDLVTQINLFSDILLGIAKDSVEDKGKFHKIRNGNISWRNKHKDFVGYFYWVRGTSSPRTESFF